MLFYFPPLLIYFFLSFFLSVFLSIFLNNFLRNFFSFSSTFSDYFFTYLLLLFSFPATFFHCTLATSSSAPSLLSFATFLTATSLQLHYFRSFIPCLSFSFHPNIFSFCYFSRLFLLLIFSFPSYWVFFSSFFSATPLQLYNFFPGPFFRV